MSLMKIVAFRIREKNEVIPVKIVEMCKLQNSRAVIQARERRVSYEYTI